MPIKFLFISFSGHPCSFSDRPFCDYTSPPPPSLRTLFFMRFFAPVERERREMKRAFVCILISPPPPPPSLLIHTAVNIFGDEKSPFLPPPHTHPTPLLLDQPHHIFSPNIFCMMRIWTKVLLCTVKQELIHYHFKFQNKVLLFKI